MRIILICRAMTNSPTLNIHFSDPTCETIQSSGKKYYMQNATSNGQEIMICSDWFRSDGIKLGLDKKPELLFKTAGRVRDALKVIESEAVRQLRMPSELLSQLGVNAGQTENKTLYKPIYNGDYMYAKLHRDCSFFNTRREMIKKSDLGYGDYRVVIAVKGLYIGSHGENGALASLHIRVFQIQYREVNVTCLFESLAGMVSNCSTPSTHNTPPETPSIFPPAPTIIPPPPPSQPSSSTKKNSRKGTKAVLSRQNAEMPIEPLQQAPVEGLPHDFFADLHV